MRSFIGGCHSLPVISCLYVDAEDEDEGYVLSFEIHTQKWSENHYISVAHPACPCRVVLIKFSGWKEAFDTIYSPGFFFPWIFYRQDGVAPNVILAYLLLLVECS